MENEEIEKEPTLDIDPQFIEVATLAGGCFWCTETALEAMDGVIDVVSGYTGGHVENPTYKEVSTGTTGHYESVQVTFDNRKLSYRELLDAYWRTIDPTDSEGQFVDRGPQYLTAIFYHSEEQRKIAEESKKELENSGKFDKPIVTKILPASTFYMAEEYHQDYSKKRTIQYKIYEKGSGREGRLSDIWDNQG